MNPSYVQPSDPAAGERRPRSRAWPWVAVGIWLASTAASFWYFELRLVRPYATAPISAVESALRARQAEDWFGSTFPAASAGVAPRATVVEFRRPGCSCNRYTDPHAARIEASFAPAGVHFVHVDRLAARLPGSLAWIAATPAAMVFDHAGRLVYFGPYSDAAWCGSQGGLVESALQRVLDGSTPTLVSREVRACYCNNSA